MLSNDAVLVYVANIKSLVNKLPAGTTKDDLGKQLFRLEADVKASAPDPILSDLQDKVLDLSRDMAILRRKAIVE